MHLLINKPKDYELVLYGVKDKDGKDGKKERLKVTSEMPKLDIGKDLFNGLGTMHLIAPYLPEFIATNNFKVDDNLVNLIASMYCSEKHKSPTYDLLMAGIPFGSYSSPGDDEAVVEWFEARPKIKARQTREFNQQRRALGLPLPSPNKVAVAFSAGKDSLWNMWWAQEKYGAENVLCVHINGLNKHNGSSERKYTERQVKKLGFKNFRMIDLLNSSRNGGYQVMRSRDMFLMGLIIPHALEFGASQIITEGFAETDNEKEPFTGQEKNMRYFNRILAEMSIPIRATWRNRKEMDVTKDLILEAPGWLPHVCNCFSAPCYIPSRRRYWEERAPRFPLYDSQCGSCVKCRITNLARVLHDPRMERVPKRDVRHFLANTAQWMKQNRGRLSDMIEGSFARDYNRACRKYNLEIKSAR